MTLLEQRMKEYEIPPITGQPTFDKVLVWRLRTKEKIGSLFVPTTATEVDNRGVLLAAGLKARDALYSEGIELGDVVWFGRYAGDERTVDNKDGHDKDVLVLEVGAITVSEDLQKRLADGAVSIRRNEDGDHEIVDENTHKMRKRAKPPKGYRPDGIVE